MNNDEILIKLESIVQDILDSPDIRLTFATTAADVEGWDSLAHIRILVAVETAFTIHFSVQEMASIDDVAAFVGLIASKQAA